MAANITDKFTEATNGTRPDNAALTAQKSIGAASITVDSTAGWGTATAVHFVIYQIDAGGARVANTQTEWKGIVSSSTSITSLTLKAGTDQVYPVGSKVIATPTAAAWDDLVEGVLEFANQDGSLITQAVRDALGLTSGETSGWETLGYAPNTITALGNRSYTVVVNSTDLTATTSVGMRLKLPRTVTAPTYMGGAFNGSSHYFTKVTPTGTLSTITNNFTIMAYVEPTSYAAGYICGRADSTPNNLFTLKMESDGRVAVAVNNGGAANYRVISTYQSLPLNKKTHVAASWTSGTVVIYFDGVSVPFGSPILGGTNPTVAGTGGDFSIGRAGAWNSTYFPGYISSVGVFDAVLTQATIRQHMNQALTGSETNCIGAWNLNNAATDASAAGNNLTATGGVGYTARTPYTNAVTGTSVTAGTTNYGIIMAQTFSTNTTYTIQIPEGETLPTTGGIGTVSYSTQKTPYGFPPMSNIISRILVGSNSAVGDYLGMTTTFTANADATYRITVVAHCTNTSALTNNVLSVIDGSTTIHSQIFGALNTINAWSIPTVVHDAKLSAGSHTIKLSSTATGGGTLVMYASGSSNIWATYTIEQLGLV